MASDLRRTRIATWLCMECGKRYEGPDRGGEVRCAECGSVLVRQGWRFLYWPHLEVVA